MAIFDYFFTIAETTWECGFQLAPPSLELLGITGGSENMPKLYPVCVSAIADIIGVLNP